MGYYTNLAMSFIGEDSDYSYPSPEMELFWRLDDLELRLEELRSKIVCDEGHITVPGDIRCALPEHLGTITEVKRAIEFARNDLRDKYGINLDASIDQISFIGPYMQIKNYDGKHAA